MLFSYKEALKRYKSNYNLKKLVEKGELFKLEKGIYSTKKIVDPLIFYCKKYDKAVVTMDSAFYYYNLTDVVPTKTHLVIDRNLDKIIDKDIVQTSTFKKILYNGMERISLKDGYINIYNRERLLVELVRKKNIIPFDYYKEIILNYRKIADKLNMYKIEEYLSLYKNNTRLFEIIESEVF